MTPIGLVSELIGVAGEEEIFPEKSAEAYAREHVIENPKMLSSAANLTSSSTVDAADNSVRKKVAERSRWAGIPAVKNDQVYDIKSPIILQPRPAALTMRIPANVTGHSGDRDRFAHGHHAGVSFVL